MTVTFIINGQARTEAYPKEKPIANEVRKLLRESGNSDDLSKYDYTVNGKDFKLGDQKFGVLPDNAEFAIINKPGTKA